MQDENLDWIKEQEYEYGFETSIDTDVFPKGINEDIIRKISAIKGEPDFMLEFRLKAFDNWKNMQPPTWGHLTFAPIDFQDISYYAAPKKSKTNNSEIDPELLETFEKLGIPLEERNALAGVAVDAIFDSVSVKTTFREELDKLGIIFCPISEAIKNHPDFAG